MFEVHYLHKVGTMSRLGALCLILGITAVSATDFDYFYLVRQWPATFCREHTCRYMEPHKGAFTIHGLWPDNGNGSWPEFCDRTSKLDMRGLADLQAAMQLYWPSFGMTNVAFWQHEWSRHGTCSSPWLKTQHEFFGSVLALHRELNLEDALAARGIVPSDTVKYRLQEVEDALTEAYGHHVRVNCDAQHRVEEIWMCISHGLEAEECKLPAHNDRCQELLLPTFPGKRPPAA